MPVGQHRTGLGRSGLQHDGPAGHERALAQRPGGVKPNQPGHSGRSGAVGRRFVVPATGALLLGGKRGGSLKLLAVGIGDHGIPMGRVAGDGAALIDHEADRVAFLDSQREVGVDAFAVLALQFVLPDGLTVVQDGQTYAIAVAVSFVDSAGDRHRPVGGREEAAHARPSIAGMVPVLAHAEPLFAALPERRLVPRLLTVLQRRVAGVLFASHAEDPLRGDQFGGHLRAVRRLGGRLDDHRRGNFDLTRRALDCRPLHGRHLGRLELPSERLRGLAGKQFGGLGRGGRGPAGTGRKCRQEERDRHPQSGRLIRVLTHESILLVGPGAGFRIAEATVGCSLREQRSARGASGLRWGECCA